LLIVPTQDGEDSPIKVFPIIQVEEQLTAVVSQKGTYSEESCILEQNGCPTEQDPTFSSDATLLIVFQKLIE
jgi:hypothetical protein